MLLLLLLMRRCDRSLNYTIQIGTGTNCHVSPISIASIFSRKAAAAVEHVSNLKMCLLMNNDRSINVKKTPQVNDSESTNYKTSQLLNAEPVRVPAAMPQRPLIAAIPTPIRQSLIYDRPTSPCMSPLISTTVLYATIRVPTPLSFD